MTTVYIETTIPSFYHTARADAESLARRNWTRQWWDAYSRQFSLYSSSAVIAELERGTRDAEKAQRLALLDGLKILEITAKVRRVAKIYIDRLLMPRDAGGDALHLALASHYGVEVLLTWNCKHLANPNKFGHIETVNGELGIPVPLLTTPLNYLSEDDAND
jgi:predicted nucleic acid-binding protein